MFRVLVKFKDISSKEEMGVTYSFKSLDEANMFAENIKNTSHNVLSTTVIYDES